MTPRKPPLPVVVVGCLYLAIGIVGLVYHFNDLKAQHFFQDDAAWIEITELAAILSGAFMLRGRNWARWLAVAWIGFHVVLSAFHAVAEFAVHAVIFVLIVWLLFRPNVARYFRGDQVEGT